MKKLVSAILCALFLVPLAASANDHDVSQTVADVRVGAELGQGCASVYAEKQDQGYQAVALGGYGVQRREGKPGSHYHPDSSDPKDPDRSLCPAPAEHDSGRPA